MYCISLVLWNNNIPKLPEIISCFTECVLWQGRLVCFITFRIDTRVGTVEKQKATMWCWYYPRMYQ